MIQLIIYLCLSAATVQADNPLVNYYVQLIQQSEGQAYFNYTFRQDNSDFPKNPHQFYPIWHGNYDFIIVGGGSAGAVLANRLSEIRQWKILLIEAGGEETNFSRIPSEMGAIWLSDLNWGYFTTPQTSTCLGMNGRRCIYPRGKVLGGSGALNAMMYVRGNRRDYDRWAALGNPGWSYNEVLPYFRKSERSKVTGDKGYHGNNGLWHVEYSNPYGPALQHFFNGSQQLGLKYLDYNGKEQIGVSQVQFNIRDGIRDSTGQGFLGNARNRPNLSIITEALATRITFDYGKIAKGVIFRKNGLEYLATATKEVVLSAGAVNSPQLLMLSGIGPRHQLQNLGIPVVEDLPVGTKLQDHVFFIGLEFRTNLTYPQTTLVEDVRQYLNGRGTLTRPGNVAGISFSSKQVTSNGAPKLEYFFIPNDTSGPALGLFFNVRNDIVAGYSALFNPETDIKIDIILLHPKTTGRVTLQSRDPLDFPLIDTNLFTDPFDEDVETVYQGILELVELMETEAFRKINATMIKYPFCNQFETFSREYFYCLIRDLSTASWHTISTTPMGPNRLTSVVDSRLRVHGVRGLRVIDAGVIPSTTSGHTNAPAVMVAEKGADIIKEDYRRL